MVWYVDGDGICCFVGVDGVFVVIVVGWLIFGDDDYCDFLVGWIVVVGIVEWVEE